MIRNHGLYRNVLALDQALLYDLINMDNKVILELLSDANDPKQSPGDYSVRDILMKTRSSKSRLWQGIFLGFNGTMYEFFPGTCPATTYQAKVFAKNPAGILKFYLVKQHRDSHFQELHVHISRVASKTKWCNKIRLIILGANIEFNKHN